MQAYHGDQKIKEATLRQLRRHKAQDLIVQGKYWEAEETIFDNDGDIASVKGPFRGCAVGCLTHDPTGGHEQFPDRWGIPAEVAHIIDDVFEALDPDEAKEWPLQVMKAIKPGMDLSGVHDKYSSIADEMWITFESHQTIDTPTGSQLREVALKCIAEAPMVDPQNVVTM